MRKGSNPTRDILLPLRESSHRVIIPLFIPFEKGYYAHAFKIFEYCLFSIITTSATKLKVSVISNNSCDAINERLFQLQKRGYIDELIIEKEAIGKINSILKALRTAEERLITITDADVLFCNGWEEAVVEVFGAFPKAGAVSPVPVFRTHLRLTSNIWLRYFFSKKLGFHPVKNPEALTRFANSIGWPWLDLKYKDVIATLKAKNGTIAAVGCSHFVVTYKREVFDKLPKGNCLFQLGGDSEHSYTDEPALKMGGYRLATYDNYAFHMGNTCEQWMKETFDELDEAEKSCHNYEALPRLKKSRLKYYLSEKIFKKIFAFKVLYKLILKQKGLTVSQIKNFID
jgi:hypothetical protein